MNIVNKYLVMKWEDIDKYLAPEQRIQLDRIVETIKFGRAREKKGSNRYMIINYEDPLYYVVMAILAYKEGHA